MRPARALPESLGNRFSIRDAREAGVSRGRLHRSDLAKPFRGTRSIPSPGAVAVAVAGQDPFARQASERRERARDYAPLLRPGQFFSHETAVALWGGPLRLVTTTTGRRHAAPEPVEGRTLPVHVSTFGGGPLVRAAGVRGHRADPAKARAMLSDGVMVSTPATMFAQLGAWSLSDLVALGDFLCRVWRPGFGRPDVGRSPLSSIDELRTTVASTRWMNVRRLRAALDLVREDSWSPRESRLRVQLVLAGLPEPLLNQDVYDDHGRFLACVDLAYPHLKIAIEYQSMLHHSRYAADVERIAALRAAGWTVIEVTSDLLSRPDALIARVSAALHR